MDNNKNNQQMFGFSAFPANQSRPFDPNIRQWIESLVDQKYRPTKYINKYKELSQQNPSLYPPLTPEVERQILMNLPDVPDIVAEFEIARVYNKLEIEIYEFAISQLPQEKRDELNSLSRSFDANNPSSLSNEVVSRIRELIVSHVPNIDQLMNAYRDGVARQYMAGRF